MNLVSKADLICSTANILSCCRLDSRAPCSVNTGCPFLALHPTHPPTLVFPLTIHRSLPLPHCLFPSLLSSSLDCWGTEAERSSDIVPVIHIHSFSLSRLPSLSDLLLILWYHSLFHPAAISNHLISLCLRDALVYICVYVSAGSSEKHWYLHADMIPAITQRKAKERISYG